jgi:hypothetical protein
MPKSVTQYNLLVSCPGDIKSEIKLIDQAVEDFNERYSDTIGIIVRTKHWRKSSYAKSGGKPQALLNEQFVNECDAAVSLLWTRFGTPTDEYGSGTEEEIEIMLAAGKQVFMYFSDKPIPPSQHDPQEYGRVQAFREKYRDRGIYFTYSSEEEFSKLFFAHLSQHFLSAKKVADLKEERAPQLLLRGIDKNGTLCETAPIQPFRLNSKHSVERYRIQIAQMYQDIAGFHMGQREIENNSSPSTGIYLSSFYPPMKIEDDRKKLLSKIAEQFELQLPEDFFDLGNLLKNTLSGMTTYGGYSLEGTADEKRKYRLIEKLYKTIVECSKWTPIEMAFSGIKCVKLAVENSGTAIDEDIEVTITLDTETLMHFDEFPPLKNNVKDYMLNKYDMDTLFSICGTAQYMNYDSAMKPGFVASPVPSTNLPNLPFSAYETDYSKDYENALRDEFCYEIYPDGQNYILKLKIDYIKHHTTVAFPVPIFLKNATSTISYKISSRNSAEVISGGISVLQ